jgi:hypothetical protein
MDVFLWNGAKRESLQQSQELLTRLAEDYQPVGAAEQLEVERIAVCWWRLGRAWRYENAEIVSSHLDVEVRHAKLISRSKLSSEEQIRLALLRKAAVEIEDTGKISDELSREILAADAGLQELLKSLEEHAKKLFRKTLAQRAELPRSAGDPLVQADLDSDQQLLLATVVLAIYTLEHKFELLLQICSNVAYDQVAIPKAEALDRLLRAESSAERNLGRAIDRLERLQRRRMGEAVPPPLSVRLTR